MWWFFELLWNFREILTDNEPSTGWSISERSSNLILLTGWSMFEMSILELLF